MKISGVSLFTIFLILAMPVQPLSTNDYGKTKVILIGIDGFNPNCIDYDLFKNPNFKWMQTEGSTTTRARTGIETMSYPGWSNISCGMETVDTGVTTNDFIPTWVKPGEMITPSTGGKVNFPCIFQAIKEQDPKFTNALYFDKMRFNYLINENTPKKFIDDQVECKNSLFPAEIKTCDKQLVDKLLDIIDKDKLPNFFYLMLGALDLVGHFTGWCNKEYKNYITLIDTFIGQIKKNYKPKGF